MTSKNKTQLTIYLNPKTIEEIGDYVGMNLKFQTLSPAVEYFLLKGIQSENRGAKNETKKPNASTRISQ